MLERWKGIAIRKLFDKATQRNTVWRKNNLKFLISTIKPFIAPTDCSRFNAIQHTYSELWITRYVDRVCSEIIGRMPFAERSRPIWFKALYSWVHSLHGNQLECDSGQQYLRIPEYMRNDSTFLVILGGNYVREFILSRVTITRLFSTDDVSVLSFSSSREKEREYLM